MNRHHNINLLSLSVTFYIFFVLLCLSADILVYSLLADDNNNIATKTLRLIAAFVSARSNSPKDHPLLKNQ